MTYRIKCNQCLRPRGHCYCERVILRENRYPIKLIQSRKEAEHPFNTGRLAALSLADCEIKINHSADDLSDWVNQLIPQAPVLAFPASDAKDATTLDLPVSTPIIFIDDTWRKAKRFLYETPALNRLQKIQLPTTKSSAYGLRQAKKHQARLHPHGTRPLCTAEAVVLCLEALERRQGYYGSILECLQWVREAQDRARPHALK